MTVNIDPIAIRFFGIDVHWYGLMYVLAFYFFYRQAIKRMGHKPELHAMHAVLNNWLLHYSIIGVIVGGRLGYALFYAPSFYLSNPLAILRIWEGGMSFHGGLLGVIAAVWLAARTGKVPVFAVADFIAPIVPIGLGLGRIGNFINGELWGRPTDLPWGMVFPEGGSMPRHPSPLYEFLLEGALLYVLLALFARKERPLGQISAMFLILYAVLRFAVEFTREPDRHIGLLALGMSMGQWLCLPMLVLGAALLLHGRGRTAYQYLSKEPGRQDHHHRRPKRKGGKH